MSKTHKITAINIDYVCCIKCEVCKQHFECNSTENENICLRAWMRQVFLPMFNLPEFIEMNYLWFLLMYFLPCE